MTLAPFRWLQRGAVDKPGRNASDTSLERWLNTVLKSYVEPLADTASTTVTSSQTNGDITVDLYRVGKVVTAYFEVAYPTTLPTGQQNYTALIPSGYRPSQSYQFPAVVVNGSTVRSNTAAYAIYASGTVIKLNIVGAAAANDIMKAMMSWLVA